MKTQHLILSCILALVTSAQADVALPRLFADHMVLQRAMSVPIWGTAEPDEQVIVECAGHRAQTKANEQGRWQVRLPAMKAGGPHELVIKGNNTLTIRDVLIGDVWLASGQSNMYFPVRKCNNADQAIAEADRPNIRLFRVARSHHDAPQTNIPVIMSWSRCDSKSVSDFSGVAYFFGRKLHKALNVPIGLIQSAWGGSTVEAWTPYDVLETDIDLAPHLARVKALRDTFAQRNAERQKKVKSWRAAHKAATAAGDPIPLEPAKLEIAYPEQTPGKLYNAMIHPLIPFGMRGVIWYQGESNAPRWKTYQRTLGQMIQSWRKRWAQGNFPFLFVQLPAYPRGGDGWLYIREAQSRTLELPNTSMAVTLDIGGGLHPTNKQDVGHRLALAALADVYGKDNAGSGPCFESMTVDGNKITIRFTHTAGGLVRKPNARIDLVVAGQDRKFHTAKIRIDGHSLVVWHEKVPKPMYVRYAWSLNPICSLYNDQDLPAGPFRTDAPWDEVTAP